MCGFQRLVFLLPIILKTVADGLQEFCPKNQTKLCLLRQDIYSQELWKYWTGFSCYYYTNDARLINRYGTVPYKVQCMGIEATVPLAKVDNNTYVLYDYTEPKYMYHIRKSFVSDSVYNNYLTCCKEAVDCCENQMDEYNIRNNETHCPAIWDAWSCFPATKANTTATLPCSSQAYQSPDDVCTLYSEKYCIGNTSLAVWDQDTNYAVCAIAPIYEARHIFHVIFLGVCTVFCCPAIIIFFGFDKLRKTIRVALHRNLLIAICVRNIFTIMSKEIVILDALKSPTVSNLVLEHNGVACRVLAFFENSAKNCIYGCMVLDGFYLHKVIVRAFAREIQMKYFYLILVGLTFLPSLAWALSMGCTDADSCWMVDKDNLQWIVDSVRLTILAINTVLLLDIIRVMFLKLKHGSPTKQTMAAFRATIFLFPLFGIHIIITAHKMVYDNSCTAENFYEYGRYSMEALQGIFVSLLFCYANTEVHNEINNGYRKLAIALEQRFGLRIKKSHPNQRRRTTAATEFSFEMEEQDVASYLLHHNLSNISNKE